MLLRAAPLLLAVAGSTACATAPARTQDEGAVVATVQSFFDAMETNDVELARRIVVPDAVFVRVSTTPSGRVTQSAPLSAWISMLETNESDLHEAFEGEPVVLVEGDVAMLWSGYVFDLNGQRSHTGVDAVALVRTDDGWRIAGGAYSVVQPPTP